MKKTLAVCSLFFVCSLFVTSSTPTPQASTPDKQQSSLEAVKNRAPLQPNAFDPLPLTAIKPEGWLRRQLQIQADGLTGHLDEFWPDVGPDSGWLGGTGESWERGPYFMDGLVPLAYLLNDPKLIAKTEKWVGWTLAHQRNDGSIGPEKNREFHFLGPQDSLLFHEDNGKLKGQIDIFDVEEESDTILSYLITIGSRDKNHVEFKTSKVHQRYCRFSGNLERGTGHKDGDPDYLRLVGELEIVTVNGTTGKETTERRQVVLKSLGTDWWPNMVMLKALTQYQEATGDPRVIPLMTRYLHFQAAHLKEQSLYSWGKFRWADEVVSVLWLYNRTGDEALLDLARVLQKQGHDWKGQFADFKFTNKINREDMRKAWKSGDEDLSLSAHGVNNAMALKTSAVWSVVSRDESDRKAAAQQLNELDKYHLLPNGMFSCDEHLAGKDPSQGTELCSVVEAQFSLEEMISILGDPAYGDRLERIAFNALPGTFSKDMWAHQYDQQPNQVMSTLEKRGWTTNGPESNVFGLEPNFGCCTANMHQGWPKFVASLWMATPEGGLAAVAYGPNQVNTSVKGGVAVTIKEETEYPFRGEIRFAVNPAQSVAFPLQLRIPAWAEGTAVTVNGAQKDGVRAGEFFTLDREWQKGDQVVLTFPMRIRASRWYHNSLAVERGPLLFSLKIGEKWNKIGKGMSHPAPAPAADWEVAPTTPWNYGLVFDPDHPEQSVQANEKPMGEYPFSSDGAPIELRVKGRRIPAWKLVEGSAGPLPQSPVESSEPLETLTLIPYGAAKLRVTAFPQLVK